MPNRTLKIQIVLHFRTTHKKQFQRTLTLELLFMLMLNELTINCTRERNNQKKINTLTLTRQNIS